MTTKTLARQHLAAAELLIKHPDLGPLYMTTTSDRLLVQVPESNPDREYVFRRLVDLLGADVVRRDRMNDGTTHAVADGGRIGEVPVHLYMAQTETGAGVCSCGQTARFFTDEDATRWDEQHAACGDAA